MKEVSDFMKKIKKMEPLKIKESATGHINMAAHIATKQHETEF